MATTITCTKKALIRDNTVPVGKPAPMHIECFCDTHIPVPKPFTGNPVTCPNCRRQFDSCGYVMGEISGFDYENQAWVIDGKYQNCGHPVYMDCGCYGRAHAGEPPAANANIH